MKKKILLFCALALTAMMPGRAMAECTAKTPQELGIIDFESAGLNCWTVGNMQSTTSSYIPRVSNFSSNAHKGSKSMQFYACQDNSGNNNSPQADSAYAILPEITFEGGIQNYSMEFWFRNGGTTVGISNYNDKLYVGILSDPSDWSTLQIVGTAVNATTTYQKATVDFSSYTGQTGRIVLLAKVDENSTATIKYGSFYVDDVMIKKTTSCAAPTDLTVGNTTGRGAYFSWTGNAANYELAISKTEVHPDTVTNWYKTYAASGNALTVSDLVPGTTYYAYVKARCSATEESYYSDGLSFKTECGAFKPEDLGIIGFEEYKVSGYEVEKLTDHCWTVGNVQDPTSTTYIPQVKNSSSYAHTGSKCMQLYANVFSSQYSSTQADSCYAILPAITFEDGIQNYSMEFWFRKGGTSTMYNNTLYVGIVSSREDTKLNTLQIVDSAVNATTTYQKAIVDFSSYTGQTGYVVFLATVDKKSTASDRYGKFYVDDVQVYAPTVSLDEGTTVPASEWDTYLANHPNAIGYTENTSIQKNNVFVKQSDGSYKTSKLVLTDGVDFQLPAALQNATLKADEAEYTRQLAAGQTMGTVVLPFAIKNNSSDYKLGYVSDASVYGITVSLYADGEEIAAGTPIFFQATTPGAELTFTASSTGLNITNDFTNSCTATNWTMNGTYAAITSGNASVAGGKQIYYIGTDNAFYYANQDFPCNAFRGWLETTEARPTSAPSRLAVSIIRNQPTGLEAVENANENVKFIQNGKLYIRHNGQVFDANGKVIK